MQRGRIPIGDVRHILRPAVRGFMYLLTLLLSFAITACTATPHIEPSDGARDHLIHVVRHGWHTGIVVRIADIPPEIWPEAAAEFPRMTYLEVGWGDRRYYMHPDSGAGTASRAAVFGGPGVLHVVGLPNAPRVEFPRSEVVALPVSREGFDRLCAYFAASFERDAAGGPVLLGDGLYGVSRFYASSERFHLLNTCNVWTARALREAGLPIAPALTAGSIIDNARRAAREKPGDSD